MHPSRKGLTAVAVLLACVRAGAALPAPDHVVIVVEENHSAQSILGNTADAPFINQLAAEGVSFTNFYGISHPSQPNYLQFFSGASQGVYTNDTSPSAPFSTPNLGSALLNSSLSFTGYSEDLPSVGYTGDASGYYVRRHNPQVNWQNDISPTLHQLPSSTNQPFSAFPTSDAGFAALPTVSLISPNLQNDMHDGTIQQADTWLSTKIGPYRDWAMTHNSLLIVTWDEDDHQQNNKIPTIFVGPMVRGGVPAAANQPFNLHNLLRTVEDMYNVPRSGSAARVAPITGVWNSETDPANLTKSFRQGDNGFAGTRDTYIESSAALAAHAAGVTALTDGSPLTQALLRFEGIVGAGLDQIPAGAEILRAKLRITTSSNPSAATMAVHRMLVPWSDGDSWNSLLNGIALDGVEALGVADTAMTPEQVGVEVTFDVTTTVQEWADGAPNFGWVVTPSGTDGWVWNTSEATLALRPVLEVTLVPEPAGALLLAAVAGSACRRRHPR